MSVLDQMTQGILGPKVTRAIKLTPVKGEEPTTVADMVLTIPQDVPGAFMARESMADAVVTLRAMSAQFEAIAAGIEVLLGIGEAVVANDAKTDATSAKLAEREADRKAADRKAASAGDVRAVERVIERESFDAMLAAKAEAAQAATFAALDDDGTEEATSNWSCPQHGDKDIHNLVARKSGRRYRACGACDEYEPAPPK